MLLPSDASTLKDATKGFVLDQQQEEFECEVCKRKTKAYARLKVGEFNLQGHCFWKKFCSIDCLWGWIGSFTTIQGWHDTWKPKFDELDQQNPSKSRKGGKKHKRTSKSSSTATSSSSSGGSSSGEDSGDNSEQATS